MLLDIAATAFDAHDVAQGDAEPSILIGREHVHSSKPLLWYGSAGRCRSRKHRDGIRSVIRSQLRCARALRFLGAPALDDFAGELLVRRRSDSASFAVLEARRESNTEMSIVAARNSTRAAADRRRHPEVADLLGIAEADAVRRKMRRRHAGVVHPGNCDAHHERGADALQHDIRERLGTQLEGDPQSATIDAAIAIAIDASAEPGSQRIGGDICIAAMPV